MIIDTIDNLKKYVPLWPRLAAVADFLAAHDLQKLPLGRHQIAGEDVYVNVQQQPGKRADEARLEYHHKWIDVQVPLDATESYGYRPIADVPEAADSFDEEADIGFTNRSQPQQWVTCEPGMFVIFTPEDAHAPCVSKSNWFKKVVFKIKI